MSNKKKIQEIKDLANKLPDVIAFNPKGKYTGNAAPTAPTVPTPTAPGGRRFNRHPTAPGTTHGLGQGAPTRPISHSVPAVKEMQQAILNFANAAAATDVTALQGNQQGQQYGEQSRTAPMDMPESKDLNAPEDNKKEFLGGSDPFGNFITQNYIPKDSFTGRQYLNVDVAGGKNRTTHSSQPMNLRGIIDSMKRIGTPGSSGTEKSVDGVWQTRTNNALHIIIDLVAAMQTFITDMKIQVPGFTTEQLEAFKKSVPQVYTELKTPEDIKSRALLLTPQIIEMTKFFQNLKPTVFENKQLRQYIDQKTPFTKYDKKPEIPQDLRAVNEDDSQSLAKQSLPINLNGAQTTISLTDLYSPELFKKYVNKLLGGNQDAHQNDEATKKILNMVADQLNHKINLGI